MRVVRPQIEPESGRGAFALEMKGSKVMLRDWISEERVHAIHVRDLKRTLSELGLLEKIQDGTLRCCSCGSRIDPEDIQCLFMDEGQVRACCSNVECLERVLIDREVREDG